MTCDLGTIGDVAGSNSRVITIAAQVPAYALEGEILSDTAVARGLEADDVPGNDQGRVATLVHRRANLALSKAASSEPVLAGDLLTYTLTLSNAGPSDAAGIAVTDTLPAGLLFASGSAGCTEAAGLVTCTRAELAAGAAAPVTIVVTVPSSTAEGQLLPNRAELTAAETDPDPDRQPGRRHDHGAHPSRP